MSESSIFNTETYSNHRFTLFRVARDFKNSYKINCDQFDLHRKRIIFHRLCSRDCEVMQTHTRIR